MNMRPGQPIFDQSVAGQAEIGRVCPYCRFPFKEGVQIALCGVCSASHHADCWQDNGGCAVIACPGGPRTVRADQVKQVGAAPTVAHAAHAGQQAQPVVPSDSSMWPPPEPPSPGGRSNAWLTAAVIILAVVIGGAAVAIVLTGQGRNTPRLVANTATTQTVTVPETATVTTVASPSHSTAGDTYGATVPSGEGALPGVSNQQMRSEIQRMLLEWHEDVVHGNYKAAWEILSRRKQVQDSGEYGYTAWVKNQATLRPYLNPAGLQVSIESTEPSAGVAQVDVTGMGWDKPGASCQEWSGITWVKYEDGAWRYDPGYSTTTQREHEWKPRYSELLGGRC